MSTRLAGVALVATVTAAALLVVTFDAPAQNAPKRKPGLWQQSMTTAGAPAPPIAMTMCTDEKTDDLLAARADTTVQCTRQAMRNEGSTFVIEAVCKDGATTIKTRGVFSGDFTSRYTGELRSTFDPPHRGVKETTQKIEARWIGPCKPGQKPGDVHVEGMGGMNVKQMMDGDPKAMQEMMNDPKKMQQMREMLEKMKQMQQQK